ncbi:MAG: Tetracycline resistance protein, class B [Candidatus Heimdallarchaeota archaeon LC_2]|nr:MAG: Tetracycline resistance protein, class B [Candidatus Heimdallarchaeota archaeon LC_2]
MEKYRINVILLASVSLLVHTGIGIIFPIFPKILEEWGKGALELGILAGSYGVTYVIFSPIFGSWADKYGKKKIIVIGLFGFGISNLLFVFAIYLDIFEILLIARGIEGIFASAVFPASIAMVSDIVPEKERAKNIGIVSAGAGIGLVIGPVLGGFLYNISIEFPFYVSAGLAFLTVVWAYTALSATEINVNQNEKLIIDKDKTGFVNAIKRTYRILPNPKSAFFIFVLVDMASLISWMLVQPGISFYIYNDLLLTPTDFGFFVAAYGLFAAIGEGFLGTFSDKVGRRPMIFLGSLLNALFFVALLNATNLMGMVIAAIIAGMSLGFMAPAMKALISDAAKKENRTMVIGTASGLTFIGTIIGPILGGFLYDRLSMSFLFKLSIGISIIGALLSIFLVFNPVQQNIKTQDLYEISATMGN